MCDPNEVVELSEEEQVLVEGGGAYTFRELIDMWKEKHGMQHDEFHGNSKKQRWAPMHLIHHPYLPHESAARHKLVPRESNPRQLPRQIRAWHEQPLHIQW